MAGVESELHPKHKDSQISPEIVAESVKVFQQVFEEVINTTTEDDDQMSSYLKICLTELRSRHTVLTDQHRSLKEKVINDDVKVKETREALHGRLSDLEQEIGSLNEKITILEDENTKLKQQVPESELQEEVSLSAVDTSVRNNQITELNTMNDQSMSEILLLKSTHEAKQDTLTADIGRLNMELREKCQVIEALNKNMDSLKLEKNGVKAQLDTLHAEKCHQDNLIQEGLDILEDEHARVLSSLDNAQKDANELKLKVAELEREVNMQKEVISDMAEEKREAIRQLSFSLEHYMSRYKELRQAFVSRKRHAVLSS